MGLRFGWLGAVLLCAAAAGSPGPDKWRAAFDAGSAAASEGDYDDAVRDFREALREAGGFTDSDGRLLDTLTELALACEQAEECDSKTGEQAIERALRIRKRAAGQGDMASAGRLAKLARAASADSRHYSDALACYRDALAIYERRLGPAHEEAAAMWAGMAWVYRAQAKPAEAVRTFQHALELRQKAGAEDTAGFARLLEEFAQFWSAQGNTKASTESYERAVTVWSRVCSRDQECYTISLDRIAEATADRDLAERLQSQIVEIQRRTHGDRSKQYYAAVLKLGSGRESASRLAEAEAAYRRALEIAELRPGDTSPDQADCLGRISRLRHSRGHWSEAIEPAERSLALRAGTGAKPDWQSLSTRAVLVDSYSRMASRQKAEEEFEILRFEAVNQPYYVIGAAEALGNLYYERGDFAEAAEKYEIAAASYEANPTRDPLQLSDKLLRLSRAYRAAGRRDEATQTASRATQLQWEGIRKRMPAGRATAALLIATAVVLGLFLLFGAGFGVGSYFVTRNIDRNLSALFAQSSAAPVQGLSFRGSASRLFAIQVRNWLLTLLTLGIYYFWGKVRTRRYVYACTEFDGDALAFHGTGRELLLGWLKAAPFIAFIFLFPRLLPIAWPSIWAPPVAAWTVIFLILLLWPVAQAGAYRYRTSRTSWRAVRFSFRAGTFRFLGLNLKGYALTVLTGGMYRPVFDVQVRRYMVENTWFGDRCFRYSGRGLDLLPGYVLAAPFALATFGISWAWWRAACYRYDWAHTEFGNTRFRASVTGGALLGLWLGNVGLLVSTLGLAMPAVIARTARFWTSRIQVIGDLDLAAIRQEAQAASAVAESFADFLGFDFGF